MTLERAIELIKEIIDWFKYPIISGESATDDDVINWLFVIGFTEEELIEVFGYTEDAIDSANASIMSAPEQFE